jgi:hypothetical protein
LIQGLPGIVWKLIIKYTMERFGCDDSCNSKQEIMAGSCEHGNGFSDSIKSEDYLYQLRYHQILGRTFLLEDK